MKLLDFFNATAENKKACEHFVEIGGLKYLFPIFLGSRLPKMAQFQATTTKARRQWLHAIEEQGIRILYALCQHLDDSSPSDSKARFLVKFVQDERKCDRVVELLLAYDEKSRKAEYNFYRSDVEETLTVQDEETVKFAALDAKLRGGGDLFYRLGALTAHLCVNSKRCHERISSQLHMQQSGISVVKASLTEFMSVLQAGPQREKIADDLRSLCAR